jgi:AraC-like DNA-binding protein
MDRWNGEPTASISALKGLLAAGERLGVARAPVLEAIGLGSTDLKDEDGRIPVKFVASLDAELRTRLGPTAAVRLGEVFAAEHASIHGYLCDCARTLRELFELLSRYSALAIELPAPRLEVRGGVASFGCRYPDDVVALFGATIERELAVWAARARKAAAGNWALVRIDLQAADTADADREGLFRAPVRTRAAATSLVFDAALLDADLPSGDGTLLGRLEPIAEQMLRALTLEGGFSRRVRAALARSLERGRSNVEDVARELAVSPRTLQRRLGEEGTTFGAVCDETRRAAALEHLRDRRLGIKETAFRLGFSEPSTFYRAFRRWTGDTPANYRRAYAT